MAMDSVVHFEMPAEDNKRVSQFYSTVFGWGMQQMGSDMGSYLLAMTTQSDEKTGRPKNPGAINGGFFEKKDDELNRVPHLVISVDNLQEKMKMVKENGGEIIGESMDIPGVGKYASFRDTEGNIVGILQPQGM
jgi:predicted enzyme related to lactoylglutathione lyase